MKEPELTLQQKKAALRHIKNVLSGESDNWTCEDDGICVIFYFWYREKIVKNRPELIYHDVIIRVFPEMKKLKEIRTTESIRAYWFNTPEERLKALEIIKL